MCGSGMCNVHICLTKTCKIMYMYIYIHIHMMYNNVGVYIYIVPHVCDVMLSIMYIVNKTYIMFTYIHT